MWGQPTPAIQRWRSRAEHANRPRRGSERCHLNDVILRRAAALRRNVRELGVNDDVDRVCRVASIFVSLLTANMAHADVRSLAPASPPLRMTSGLGGVHFPPALARFITRMPAPALSALRWEESSYICFLIVSWPSLRAASSSVSGFLQKAKRTCFAPSLGSR